MVSGKLFALSAIIAMAAGQIKETIQGYTYIHSGPKNPQPQIEYELFGARTAADLLTTRLGEEKLSELLQPDFTAIPEITAANMLTVRKALSLVKSKLGEDGLLSTLKPDIDEANTFWHDVVAKSTPNTWAVSADARGAVFLPNITATRFALWTNSPLADRANNDANPEHWFKRSTTIVPGEQSSEILEGWGGVTTFFHVPIFGVPDRVLRPYLRLQPEFPIQAAGDKVLNDGADTVFGVLHISIRDVKGADFGVEEESGFEVLATVWYGDGATDEFLEKERGHMVTEIVNLGIQAQKDLESGEFVPPV